MGFGGKRAAELGRVCFFWGLFNAHSRSTLQLAGSPLTQPCRNLDDLDCSFFLTLVSSTTWSPFYCHRPSPSWNCHSLLSSQSFTPDLPSRHIQGQMGLLKTSISPAVEATIPSELPQPPCPRARCAQLLLLEGWTQRRTDSHSWVTYPDIVIWKPDRENPKVFRLPQDEGRGCRASGLLCVTTAHRKCQRNAQQWAVAQVLLRTSGFGPGATLSRHLLGPCRGS